MKKPIQITEFTVRLTPQHIASLRAQGRGLQIKGDAKVLQYLIDRACWRPGSREVEVLRNARTPESEPEC